MEDKKIEELLHEVLVKIEEQPYEVPKNWIWVNMNSVANWGSGGTPSRQNEEYYTGDIPWIKTGELKDDIIYDTSEKITEEAIKKSSAKLFPKGSVAIAMYGATIGKTGILGVNATTNQACAVAIPNETIIKRLYLFHYLKSKKDNFVQIGKGGAQPNISQTILKEYPIPIPSISEQQRIIVKIESLFSNIDNAKELIEESREGFKSRKAAIIAKAFSGELTKKWRQENPDVGLNESLIEKTDNECLIKFDRLPQTWRWVQIKDVIEKMQTKKPSSIDKEFFHYIDIESIDNKNQQIRQMKIVNVNKAPSRASRHVEKEDVLISLVRPYLKNIALVEYDQDDIIASTGFYVCKTKPIYEPKLFYYYLKTDGFTNVLTSLMRGDNSPSVRITEFPQQLIPYIPLQEQKEIVRILDNLLSFESKIEELTQLEEQIELLKKSILAKAFRGELGTNDPTEESAIELLKETLRKTK